MTAPGAAVRPGSLPARFAVGTALRLVRSLPVAWRESLFAVAARLAWALGVRRRVTLGNLACALPQTSSAERLAVARGAYRSMALAALDAVTGDLMPDAALDEVVSVADWRGLDVRLAAGQPTLVASAHFGSWELLGQVMVRRGAPVSGVVRPLAGAFNEWLVAARRRAGMELILPQGALPAMLGALRRGRTVVQLIDQALPGGHGVVVPFFGRPASTTAALSMAAVRSGAPVYVVLAARSPGRRLEMEVHGPVPVPEAPTLREALTAHAAELTRIIEAAIRARPEQWLWLHRRWKEAPRQRRAGGLRLEYKGAHDSEPATPHVAGRPSPHAR